MVWLIYKGYGNLAKFTQFRYAVFSCEVLLTREVVWLHFFRFVGVSTTGKHRIVFQIRKSSQNIIIDVLMANILIVDVLNRFFRCYVPKAFHGGFENYLLMTFLSGFCADKIVVMIW